MTNSTVNEQAQSLKKTKTPVIDCDLHANPRSNEDLLPYLSPYWRDFLVDSTWKGVILGSPPMAVVANAGHRADSKTPEGGPGCSSISFFKEQVADPYNFAYAIIYPDGVFNLAASPQHEMATALASAYNDWQIEHWLEKDPMFRGSVVVASQDPEGAAREIDRIGSHPQMVQVALSIRCPYGGWGNKRYNPIWEAALRNNLIINYHVSSPGGIFQCGFEANSFAESQTNNGLTFQAAIASLIFGGVPEKYPELKFVFNEGGFGWVPNLMYTMDTHWKMLVREVPWVKRPPSQQLLDQMWFGTQPMMDPEDPKNHKNVVALAEMIGRDKILFTSDYPHWTFDAPQAALAHFPKEFRDKILYKNAMELYKLPDPTIA